ncbi:MAG: hypothetical protein KGJ86_00770 [Chloroflexota bacterium]|nr:hypothetical protein [Chloroflexota bacterium]
MPTPCLRWLLGGEEARDRFALVESSQDGSPAAMFFPETVDIDRQRFWSAIGCAASWRPAASR